MRRAQGRRHSRSRPPIPRRGRTWPRRRGRGRDGRRDPRRRHRIDEAREGRAPAEGKVVALGEMERRNPVGRHAGDRSRQRPRAEPRGVRHLRGKQAHRCRAAGFDHEPALGGEPGVSNAIIAP
jgi:hypothetical protein